MAQAVGAVGRHLHLEHGVEGQHLVQRLAGQTVIEVMDAAGVVADAELRRRAQHPGRVVLAAEHGPNSERFGRARKQCAGRGVGHQVTDVEVGGAGEHADGLVSAGVDVGEEHAPGRLGHRLEADDPRDHDAGGAAGDVLDLGAGVDEPLHQGVERRVEHRVLAQPVERDLHPWLTKRTSFS